VRAELVLPGEISSLIQDPSFRVVLWNQPLSPSGSWFSDEWQIEDAHDVREVIEWAEAQEPTTFEVLACWEGAGNSSTAELVGYTRVAGTRPDDGFTTRVERFTSTG